MIIAPLLTLVVKSFLLTSWFLLFLSPPSEIDSLTERLAKFLAEFDFQQIIKMK